MFPEHLNSANGGLLSLVKMEVAEAGKRTT